MTQSDLLHFWQQTVPEGWENTCDHLYYARPDAEVRKVAVLFKITLQNLAEAADWGAQLIITHEPLYPQYDGHMPPEESDPVVRAMHDRLISSGIAVLRLHDHAHLHSPDFIHTGFLSRLGLPVQFVSPAEQLGIRQYNLARAYTAREIAALAAERLNMPHPRIAGNPDAPLTKVVLALGGVGNIGYEVLSRTDAELFITGELNELGSAFYANDAASLGLTKCFLVLGHCESEQYGMEYLAAWLRDRLPALDIRYFSSGPTYYY